MKMYTLKEIDNSNKFEEIIAKGTAEEILAAWESKKYELTDWMRDEATEEEIKELDEFLEIDFTEIRIADLNRMLSEFGSPVNYDWYRFEIEEK